MQRPINIGLVFDQEEDYDSHPNQPDRFAEFEPASTMEIMTQAVKKAGHKAVALGSPKKLLEKPNVDLIWNIGEGMDSRNREAWTPILSELHGIPCLGSDAHTLSVSLDKALSKILARHLNIPTADWWVFPRDRPQIEQFPDGDFFLKPRYEGSAKGLSAKNYCQTGQQIIERATELHLNYQQDILVERFLPGPEYTCALVGHPLRVLPVLERAVEAQTKIGLHVLERGEFPLKYELSQRLDSQLERCIQNYSLNWCKEMNVFDFARIDFKCDAKGQPHFLEANPLPTFATDGTFAIISEMNTYSYSDFLANMLNEATNRLGS